MPRKIEDDSQAGTGTNPLVEDLAAMMTLMQNLMEHLN